MADTTTEATTETNNEEPERKTADLGDPGKRALEAERKAKRDAERRAADAEARLKAIEDQGKSETERLTAENERLKAELGTATVTGARLRVALDKGLTATQAKRLVGNTVDELTADADELLADLGTSRDSERQPPPGGRPRERFVPGAGDPDQPEEITDVKALGERMFKR